MVVGCCRCQNFGLAAVVQGFDLDGMQCLSALQRVKSVECSKKLSVFGVASALAEPLDAFDATPTPNLTVTL